MSRRGHVKRAKLLRGQMIDWVPDFRHPFKPWQVAATSCLNDHRRYLREGGKFLRRKTVRRVHTQLSYYQGR